MTQHGLAGDVRDNGEEIGMIATATGDGHAATVTGPQVWNRLWRPQPDAARDAALLERERAGGRWKTTASILVKAFGSLRNVCSIELGSGRGDFSALLAMDGASVTLVDYSEKALAEARSRFDRLNLPAEFVRADMLGDLSELAGRFNFSVSLGVVEHFVGAARTQVVRAHHDVLADGGLAMISVPNAHCLPYRLWKLLLEIRGWWPYGLEIPYSKRELTSRAKRAGLCRIETSCVGFWQSVGDCWGRSVFHRDCDWSQRVSRLDAAMGLALQLYGWRQENGQPNVDGAIA